MTPTRLDRPTAIHRPAPHTAEPPTRPIESVPKTAERHGLSANSLYRWIANGEVPEHCLLRLGGRTQIRRRPFAAWLEEGQGATPERPQLRAAG